MIQNRTKRTRKKCDKRNSHISSKLHLICITSSNDKHPVTKTYTPLHYTWRTEKCLTPTGIRNPGRPVPGAVDMQTTQDDVNFSVAAHISCRKVVGSCKQRCMTTSRLAESNTAICAGEGKAVRGRLLWSRN